MEKFRFLNWEVYKDSRQLVLLILKLIKKVPKEYRFELSSQIIRSSFSVPLNIAEGSGKTSDKELNRFLEIALGSAYETLAAVDILRAGNLIEDSDYKEIYDKIYSISSQIGGFKRKVVGR